MRPFRISCLAIVFAVTAGQIGAVALIDCTRTTHISHGGEADHTDLGNGRVMWRDWWSQEGTATNFAIVECADGSALTFRTAEDRMNARTPFDRTYNALKIVNEQHKAARVFATLSRIADALDKTARDITLTNLSSEPCACAALYPDLRGTKKAFELES